MLRWRRLEIVLQAQTKQPKPNKLRMYIMPDDLKGKVKEHKTYHDDVLQNIMWFDENGNYCKGETYREGKLESYFNDEKDDDYRVRKVFWLVEGKANPSKRESITDAKGNLVRERYFDADGVKIWEWEYVFDEEGSPVSQKYTEKGDTTETTFSYDSAKNLIEQKVIGPTEKESFIYVFEYDADNNLTKKVKKKINGQVLKTEIIQFENGKKHSEKVYNKKGKLVKLKIFEFDEENRPTRKIKFKKFKISDFPDTDIPEGLKEYYDYMQAFQEDISGSPVDAPISIEFLVSNKRYAYDNHGNQALYEKEIYRKDFNPFGLTNWRSEYMTYNDKNLITSEKYFETHTDYDWASEINYQYAFDKQGKLLTKAWANANGGNEAKTQYIYNRKGSLTKEITIGKAGNSTEKTVIEFDGRGNAISYKNSADYSNGETRRETKKFVIEYYDGGGGNEGWFDRLFH